MNNTIFLIEDNEQNRYLMTYLLEQHGYSVTSERDGAKAVEMATTLSPVMILLDIQLPTMDGYSVARALRLIDTLVHVPIVAVTSYAMVGDREKAMAAGCSGYIEKPINPETFIEEITRLGLVAPPARDSS